MFDEMVLLQMHHRDAFSKFEEDFDDVDSVSGEENVEIFVTNMLVKSSVDDEEGDKSDAGTATL